MTNLNDPAYPTLGLTKREYFAAMAMAGLCADPETSAQLFLSLKSTSEAKLIITIAAVEIADALINTLNKTMEE